MLDLHNETSQRENHHQQIVEILEMVDRAIQDRFRRYRDKQPEGEAADERDEKKGKKNVVRRVSRASCVEWSDARESVFMVCGRRPRRVLKLRSRKTDAVRKLSIHHSPLLFTSQTHVCSGTGAAHAS